MSTTMWTVSRPLALRAPARALQWTSPRRRCCQATQILRSWSRRHSSNLLIRHVVVAAASTGSAEAPHLQLATAKLPANVDSQVFASKMYQWASTLTQHGRNLPFALPLRTDPVQDGFKISLLRVADRGSVRSVADMVARVEADGSAGNVFVVRLFEAEGSSIILSKEMQASSDAQKRLKMLLAACVDIPTIMQTMPNAIRNAVVMAR